ncbi:MAG: flagellar protein FliT, partial [Proteus vulgaris]
MDIMVAYEQVLKSSEQMLTLAKDQQWDKLIEMEMDYLKSVENITKMIKPADSELRLQQRLTDMLKKILENENETRNLLRARLDELGVLIRQTEQEQRVQNSYGQFTEHSYYP